MEEFKLYTPPVNNKNKTKPAEIESAKVELVEIKPVEAKPAEIKVAPPMVINKEEKITPISEAVVPARSTANSGFTSAAEIVSTIASTLNSAPTLPPEQATTPPPPPKNQRIHQAQRLNLSPFRFIFLTFSLRYYVKKLLNIWHH